MSESKDQHRARLLAEWLDAPPGTPPPPGVDPESVEAIYALRPDLAPLPSLQVDDLLSDVSSGPFAASSASHDDHDAGADRPRRAPADPPASDSRVVPLPRHRTSRVRPPWRRHVLPAATLAAAAAALLVVIPARHEVMDATQEAFSGADHPASEAAPAPIGALEDSAAPLEPAPPPAGSIPEVAQEAASASGTSAPLVEQSSEPAAVEEAASVARKDALRGASKTPSQATAEDDLSPARGSAGLAIPEVSRSRRDAPSSRHSGLDASSKVEPEPDLSGATLVDEYAGGSGSAGAATDRDAESSPAGFPAPEDLAQAVEAQPTSGAVATTEKKSTPSAEGSSAVRRESRTSSVSAPRSSSLLDRLKSRVSADEPTAGRDAADEALSASAPSSREPAPAAEAEAGFQTAASDHQDLDQVRAAASPLTSGSGWESVVAGLPASVSEPVTTAFRNAEKAWDSGDTTAALAWLEPLRAHEHPAVSAEAAWMSARWRLTLGDRQAALRLVDGALERQPESTQRSRLLALRGSILEALGRTEEAWDAYDEALR